MFHHHKETPEKAVAGAPPVVAPPAVAPAPVVHPKSSAILQKLIELAEALEMDLEPLIGKLAGLLLAELQQEIVKK